MKELFFILLILFLIFLAGTLVLRGEELTRPITLLLGLGAFLVGIMWSAHSRETGGN